jgi:hypothetical protein
MTWGFGGTRDLKWSKKRNQFENSTQSCRFLPDEMKAYSYGACIFRMVKGVPVFNNSSYSNTTSSHQSVIRSILYKRKIKTFDLYDCNIHLLGNSDRVVIDELIMKCLKDIEYTKQIQDVPNKYFTEKTKAKYKDTSHLVEKLKLIETTFKTKATKEQKEIAKVYTKEKFEGIIQNKDHERQRNKEMTECKAVKVYSHAIERALRISYEERQKFYDKWSVFSQDYVMPIEVVMKLFGVEKLTVGACKQLEGKGVRFGTWIETWELPEFNFITERVKKHLATKSIDKEVDDFLVEVA